MEEFHNQPPDDPEKPDDDDEDEEERGSALAEMFRSKREEQTDSDAEAEPEESWFSRLTEAAKEEAAETKPVSEAEAPIEAMSAEAEAPVVASTLAEHELRGIPEHQPDEPVNEEVAADMAAADFYERVEETGDLEAAEAATTEALESDIEPAETEVAAEAPPEQPAEIEPETPAEIDPNQPQELAEEDLVDLQAEAAAEPEPAAVEAAELAEPEEPEDPAQATPSPPPPPIPVPPNGGPGGPGNTGGHNTVPNPPVPPNAGGPSGPGGPGGPAGPTFGGPNFGAPNFGGGFNTPNLPNFNAVPAAAAPNLPHYERIDDRASPAAMALFGGIVGYLIGRRRGRIKTEKKLLPIQKNLEQQVTDLHWEMKAKEEKIRQLAREKVRQTGPAAVETLAAAAIARKETQAKQAQSQESGAENKIRPLVIAKTIEVPPERRRQKAPEANQLHGAKAEQKIGHVLAAAEVLPMIAAGGQHELAPSQPDKPVQKEIDERLKHLTETRVETLNRADLLAISEKIIIDGSSLRQIYETHLIGEHGLRRLIREHLRGGDLKKALRREIVEREIDFERDPGLRDKIDPSKTGAAGGAASAVPAKGGQDALGRMIERAEATLPADEQAAFYRAKANYEIEQRAKDDKKRNLVDLVFGVVIVTLVTAIVAVYLSRG